MNPLKIRPPTKADIPSILELVNYEILKTTANYSYEPNSLEVQMKWFESHQENNFPVLVADWEGQVVGCGVYSVDVDLTTKHQILTRHKSQFSFSQLKSTEIAIAFMSKNTTPINSECRNIIQSF